MAKMMMKSMAKAMKASGMKKMMKSMAMAKMAMKKKAMKKTAGENLLSYCFDVVAFLKKFLMH